MPSQASTQPRRPSPYKRLPLWLQWGLPFAIAGVLIAALVYWVRYESTTAPLIANVNSPKAIAEQNREARVLIGQDQAPHVVRLPAGTAPRSAIRTAVVAFMHHKIKRGIIVGPVSSSSCTSAPSGTSGRLLFKCIVKAASVNYPFEGAVLPAKHQLVYCKRDKPPVPSMNIPLSSRCT